MSGAEKHRRRKSLFTRYITFFAIVEIISLIAFGIVLFYFVADTWEDAQKQNLLNYADNIAEVYEYMLHSEEPDGEISRSGLCYTISSIASAAQADIFICDINGNIMFCKDMADTEDGDPADSGCEIHSSVKIPGEFVTGILADGMLATKKDFSEKGNECFIAASVASDGYESSADGIVIVLQRMETGLRPYHTRFLQIYVMAALVLLIAISLITYVTTYSMTRPLREMSEATKHYSVGNFSYRIKRNDGNIVREFDELAAAINSMAEKLEQLESSRKNFVANVSHELKTPMTTIGGFIDGILDGTIDAEHQAHYLMIVSDEVKRLSRLVVSMLNMSKMEAGELCIQPTRFNLTQQILGIFIAFEQKINDKNIHIRGLNYLMNTYIEADPDMINQVFYNLIDNAVKFTNTDGEITVSMNNDDEFVYVRIKNTGKGIGSQDIGHIFERFYKGDKSRSLDAKSVGLGLFIVRNIVELHHGEITASSMDNKYTEFTVKLKLKLIDMGPLLIQ